MDPLSLDRDVAARLAMQQAAALERQIEAFLATHPLAGGDDFEVVCIDRPGQPREYGVRERRA